MYDSWVLKTWLFENWGRKGFDRMTKVDAACRGRSVGRVNNPITDANAKVNSLADLEAIWANSPAPAEKVAVAA